MIKELVKSVPVTEFRYVQADGMLASNYKTVDGTEISYKFICSGAIHDHIYYNTFSDQDSSDEELINDTVHELTVIYLSDVARKPKKIIISFELCREYRACDFDVNVYNIDLLTRNETYALLDLMKNGLRYKTPEIVNILLDLKRVINKSGGELDLI